MNLCSQSGNVRRSTRIVTKACTAKAVDSKCKAEASSAKKVDSKRKSEAGCRKKATRKRKRAAGTTKKDTDNEELESVANEGTIEVSSSDDNDEIGTRKPDSVVNEETILTAEAGSSGNKTEIDNVKVYKEKLVPSDVSKLEKHLHNIRTILKYSNATAIRRHIDVGYTCLHCPKSFPQPMDLKNHTLLEHANVLIPEYLKSTRLSTYVIKLDITSLRCNVCCQGFAQLEDFVEHLRNSHNKEYHMDVDSHILPFKFDGGPLTCALCPRTFNHFKDLQEHMSSHYANFTCEDCPAQFVNKHGLLRHTTRMHVYGNSICDFCSKVFETRDKRLKHEQAVHNVKPLRYKCQQCFEKFNSYTKKLNHMVARHGAKPAVYKCTLCERTFKNSSKLSIHKRRDHMLERQHGCAECDARFYSKTDLKKHMVRHAGRREHRCFVCGQHYSRKKIMMEHLRIHAEDRRFKCDHCGRGFVQKITLKDHIRCKHWPFV
ncbi:unnamed protein product, partial [Iphiclides podalirius]